jgi:hypothetical protein
MRRTFAALIAASAATWAPLAFAQDPPPPPAANQTTSTTQTQTTSTTPSAPPVTSTTTTTQAAVDTSLYPPAPPPVPATESGGGETTTYINRPLLVTGLFLFGASYVPAIAIAAESSRPADRPNLYIPVAGPWIDYGQRGCTTQLPCSNESGNKALLVVDGVTQGVGALAMVTSLFIPEKKSRHWFFIGNDTVHATPTMIGGGYGLAAAGKF